ncbi:uncharacterized protein BDW47DRAFT_114373 [Aspergillus candidus]|uniref:Uncharacterized protein n=1 Tax=Aspergillus candidus TaxID=41067 RepID=A0A2I2EXX4_ASPCN|nr:hypothetical protein BDW47DRAFT_114373 [Aspergillus candidus]PLB33211.1 hypothetical protein BDW47DRAFT_114373 [Aspergillus candidus]
MSSFIDFSINQIQIQSRQMQLATGRRKGKPYHWLRNQEMMDMGKKMKGPLPFFCFVLFIFTLFCFMRFSPPLLLL